MRTTAGIRVSGVILAGGRGSRAGGADKGLISHSGRPLIEWVIERISPQVDELLISANRNLDLYARYGYPVLRDACGDFSGPLAGVQSALQQASGDWLMTAPCDTPSLPTDLAERLLAAVAETPGTIAVAATEDGWQPTISLIPRTGAAALDAYLAAGRRRVRDWIAEQPHAVVVFGDRDAFVNLNDWQQNGH